MLTCKHLKCIYSLRQFKSSGLSTELISRINNSIDEGFFQCTSSHGSYICLSFQHLLSQILLYPGYSNFLLHLAGNILFCIAAVCNEVRPKLHTCTLRALGFSASGKHSKSQCTENTRMVHFQMGKKYCLNDGLRAH